MREPPPDAVEVAIEIGRVASEPTTIEARAAAVLTPLRRLVPFQAAWIGLLDHGSDSHRALAIEGYPDHIRQYFGTTTVTREIELLNLHRNGRPTRRRDIPIPVDLRPVWADYLWPAGFREGVAMGLTTRDGRHLGIIALNTDTEAHPTEAARDLIGALGSLIADAIDPLHSVTAAATMIEHAWAGVVLTRAGAAFPLSGMPTHALLRAGSPVLAVAAQRLTTGEMLTSFLCPNPDPEHHDRHLRITVVGVDRASVGELLGAVLVSDAGDLGGLTRRELEILGLLVEGWPNQRIGQRLSVVERTVAAHVEHIRIKLAAPSRTLAAIRALRRGWYVPAALINYSPAANRATAASTL